MAERPTNSNEISYSALPKQVREMLSRIKNSTGVVIGNLEVRNPGYVYYQGKRVIDLPDTDHTSNDRTTVVTTRAESDRASKPVVHEIVPSEGVGTVLLSSLPREAQGYIANYFGKLTMSFEIDGQRLEIGTTKITYGGKKVIMEVQKQEISFEMISLWAQQMILRAISQNEAVVEAREGERLVVFVNGSDVQVTFNKVTVTNIPR